MIRSGVPSQAMIVHPLMSPEAPGAGGRLPRAVGDPVRRMTQYTYTCPRHAFTQDMWSPRSPIWRFPPHPNACFAAGLNAVFPLLPHSISWELPVRVCAGLDGGDRPPDQPNGPCRQLFRVTHAVPSSRIDWPQVADPNPLPPMPCRWPVGDSLPSIVAKKRVKGHIGVLARGMGNRLVDIGDHSSEVDSVRGTSTANSVPPGDTVASLGDFKGCRLGCRQSKTRRRRPDGGNGVRW